MTSKTIKISEENYRRLLKIATDIQRIKERKITFDGALDIVIEDKELTSKNDIMKSAGSWKMSDEEWNETRKTLKISWRKWKTQSA
jgi:predicted CopG family antitoxin